MAVAFFASPSTKAQATPASSALAISARDFRLGHESHVLRNRALRHAMVDTDGRPLVLQPASVQDRDGAIPLLKSSRCRFLFVERAFADTAYVAPRVADATRIAIEIVRKPTN
jgi:hypothetical protein